MEIQLQQIQRWVPGFYFKLGGSQVTGSPIGEPSLAEQMLSLDPLPL